MAFCSQSYLLLFAILVVDSFAQPDATDNLSSFDGPTYNNVLLAHAIIYAIAFALVFPAGALLLRLFPSRDLVWYHTGVQIVGVIFIFIGFGLGGWLCAQYSPVSNPNRRSKLNKSNVGSALYNMLTLTLHLSKALAFNSRGPRLRIYAFLLAPTWPRLLAPQSLPCTS